MNSCGSRSVSAQHILSELSFTSRNVSKEAGRLTSCCTKKQVSLTERPRPLNQVLRPIKGLAEALMRESGAPRPGV